MKPFILLVAVSLYVMSLQSQVIVPERHGKTNIRGAYDEPLPFPMTQQGVVVTPYQRMVHQDRQSDGMKRLDSMVLQFYNNDLNTILNYWKYTYEYNAAGQNHSMIFAEWDLKKWDWLPQHKMVLSYDPNGLVEERRGYFYFPSYWDTLHFPWIPDHKVINLYNQNHQLVESIDHRWLMGPMQWRPSMRVLTDLDSAGRPLMTELFSRDHQQSVWNKSMLVKYVYNTEMLPAEIIKHLWSDYRNTYQIRRRTLFTYDHYGQVSNEILQWYDTLTGLYHNSQMLTLEWDQNNNLIQEILYGYNYYSPGWNPQWKYEFDFDATQNITARNSFYFNYSLQQWDHMSMDDLFHDNSWTYSDLLLPYVIDMNSPEYFRHKLDSVVGYQAMGLAWERIQVGKYYYSLYQPIAVDVQQPLRHKVYPNPATTMVTFELPELDGRFRVGLYDLTGRQILHKEFSRQVSFSVCNLSPGVYIYRINGANGLVQTGKLVVGL